MHHAQFYAAFIMKKLKIALMGSFPIYPYRERVAFWNNRPGLTTTWNYNLAYALAGMPGLEVHFLTHAPLFRTQVLEDRGLFIHFIGHLPKLDQIDRITNLQYSRFNLNRYLRTLNPDVIHASGVEHEYAYVAALSRKPKVLTVHGVISEVVRKNNPPRSCVDWTYARYENFVLAHIPELISINPYVEQQFPDYKGRIHRISNPIAPHFFEQKTSEEYELVFVGRITERKRVLNLIEAVAAVQKKTPAVRLKIIGGGDSYEMQVRARIEDCGLAGNVTLTGPLPQAQIAEEVAKAACLILPSIEETAPMVIAEAQAMGKPVIATDVGGIKYMVEDGVSGFVVEPDNIDQLTDRIERILNDEALRRSMSIKAREASMKYHPDVVAEKTAAVYREILRQRSDV
jgi:glycosyltransferase involved in cell wall biosynthesis